MHVKRTFAAGLILAAVALSQSALPVRARLSDYRTTINTLVANRVASGTAALATDAIASGTCATAVTVAATGVLTTDTIVWTHNADPTAVTGYTAATTGRLFIVAYPTAGNVNFKVCNPTSGSITPGSALTLNWRVAR